MPPLAVFLRCFKYGPFFLSFFLCGLFWIPAVVHAFLYVKRNKQVKASEFFESQRNKMKEGFAKAKKIQSEAKQKRIENQEEQRIEKQKSIKDQAVEKNDEKYNNEENNFLNYLTYNENIKMLLNTGFFGRSSEKYSNALAAIKKHEEIFAKEAHDIEDYLGYSSFMKKDIINIPRVTQYHLDSFIDYTTDTLYYGISDDSEDIAENVSGLSKNLVEAIQKKLKNLVIKKMKKYQTKRNLSVSDINHIYKYYFFLERGKYHYFNLNEYIKSPSKYIKDHRYNP